MRLLTFIALLIPITSMAAPVCGEGRAVSEELRSEATALGVAWMDNAMFCDLGIFQVLTSVTGNFEEVVILKNGKLFLIHQKDLGINLFQDYEKSLSKPYVTVQDRNKDGIYESLDYSLVDENGNVVGNVWDKFMDGNVDVVRYKK